MPAPEPSRFFLAGRALLAVALMVAFYGLALVMITLLLGVILLEWRIGRFNLQLTVFVIVGAFAILQAIVPRRDRFLAPGPRLDPAQQPRLFAEIREVAAATAQEMPAEVYLVLPVNAWVSQRGGFMGIGSRRVMGLGLPLLQVLDRPQLRGVIAHEFGHYHGGDVRIGPWIYATRAALVRTLQELSSHSGILTLPFQWYAALFFRVSHAVSRHQELLADALAARVAGAAALAGGLRATHAARMVFPSYLHADVLPVVSEGYLPPLVEGFARVLERPEISRQLEEALKKEYEPGKQDPYDTHPPLQERLAALGMAAEGPAIRAGERALALLDGLPALERAVVDTWVHPPRDAPQHAGTLNLGSPPVTLAALAWDEVGAKVALPKWKGYGKQFSRGLTGITPSSLPTLDWAVLGGKLSPGGAGAQAYKAAETVVGVAMGLVLVRQGYTIDSRPGARHTLVRGEERVDVFALRELLRGSPSEVDAWQTFCERTGIGDDDLGTVARAD